MVQHLDMDHQAEVVSVEEAIETIPEATQVLKTHDPHMPNHVAALIALKLAKQKGIRTISRRGGKR